MPSRGFVDIFLRGPIVEVQARNLIKTEEKLFVIFMALSIVTLCLTTESFAQRGGMKCQGSGGRGPGTPYQRLYNPATVETISGTVEGIEKVTPMKGMYPAIELIVKTDKETIPVHLGPEWYIGRLDTKIEKRNTAR